METAPDWRPAFAALARRVEELAAELAKRPAAPSRSPQTALVTGLMAQVARALTKPSGIAPTSWLTTTEIAERLQLAPGHLKPLGQALRAAGYIRKPIRNGAKVEGRYAVAVRPS